MNYLLTARSDNAKTGPVATVIADRRTCPAACPLRGAGCYAEQGPLALAWRAVSRGGGPSGNATIRPCSISELCERVRALPADRPLRYAVAGDLPGRGNRIDAVALRALADACADRPAWTYTHKPVLRPPGRNGALEHANRAAVASANERGLTVNLSADGPITAPLLASTGLPVATMLPSAYPDSGTLAGGYQYRVCPAQRSRVRCLDCLWCARPHRGFIVAFRTHGVRERAAEAIALTH